MQYLSGFGNHHASEALPGALPAFGNSPQKCPYGLYAEQISGTAFTAPRHQNQRSWLYRIRPSVVCSPYTPCDESVNPPAISTFELDPNQMRWDPPALPSADVDFVDSLAFGAVCGAGDASAKSGLCIYNYACNKPMLRSDKIGRCMCNADGDLLIVPQLGNLLVTTEFGKLEVEVCEIVVIPRGIKFAIDGTAADGVARGYVLELHEGHFELPQLGPLGANGLANPRDFQAPVCSFHDVDGESVAFEVMQKFSGRFFRSTMGHNPFDVVAWHGNYVPYKYDLRKFCAVNTVTFDHPDPCIFTVLTAPSAIQGIAVADFVIFPPRWMVATKTFRPPYYHRNIASEYMGMIYGQYDAKAGGFVAGGASLHSCGTPHGPDATTFEKASNADLQPGYFGEGLAFMFESAHMLRIAPGALRAPARQTNYSDCWQGLKKHFTGSP